MVEEEVEGADASPGGHTYRIYLQAPRTGPKGGRPYLNPPQHTLLEWKDLSDEALASLEALHNSKLSPGAIAESDGVIVARGPAPTVSAGPVKAEAVPPFRSEGLRATPEMVEALSKSSAGAEVLSTMLTAHPGEAARFALEVMWDTHMRVAAAAEDAIARNKRLADAAVEQREQFVNLLQKTSELELEMKAQRAEEDVRSSERARAQARRAAEEAAAASAAPKVTLQDLMAVLKQVAEGFQKTQSGQK